MKLSLASIIGFMLVHHIYPPTHPLKDSLFLSLSHPHPLVIQSYLHLNSFYFSMSFLNQEQTDKL